MQNILNNKSEVSGEFILNILNELHDIDKGALIILKKNGIEEPVEEKWYPFDTWIKAFREISLKIGPTRLYIIGTRIFENIESYDNDDCLNKAMDSVDGIYRRKHRNQEFGNFKLLKFDDITREAEIMSNTQYPCDFERGIIMGLVNKYKPDDSRNIWVVHKDLRSCRKRGLDGCIYLIKW